MGKRRKLRTKGKKEEGREGRRTIKGLEIEKECTMRLLFLITVDGNRLVIGSPNC